MHAFSYVHAFDALAEGWSTVCDAQVVERAKEAPGICDIPRLEDELQVSYG